MMFIHNKFLSLDIGKNMNFAEILKNPARWKGTCCFVFYGSSLLPNAVKVLFSVTELKQQAVPLGIKKIDAHVAGGRVVFNAEPKINTEQLISLIQTQPQCYKFDGSDKLRFTKTFEAVDEKIDFLSTLLEKLTP